MQKEFFNILDELFQKITGKPATKFATPDTFIEIMKKDTQKLAQRASDALPKGIEALCNFYNRVKKNSFAKTRSCGGMKLVFGGSSRFGASHLQAVRKMLLYADTILIPDPILPWVEVEREEEKFRHVHLLKTIFMLLQLKPLVDADLTYPAISVFPSYEKSLENNDETTRKGIENLALNFFSYYIKKPFQTMDEILGYVRTSEEKFLHDVEKNNLFIAPGGHKGADISKAIKEYKAEIKTWRSNDHVKASESLTSGELIWMGIYEHLIPQWHLLENANELNSQPMLCIESQWHYYQLCTKMFEGRLFSADLLKTSTMNTIRALNENRVEWLGNIPIDILVRLREQNENEEFRKRIAEFTSVLHDASIDDIDRVASEVVRGIASLLSEHKNKVREIQEKCNRFHAQTLVAGIVSLAPVFIPSLAPFVQYIPPLALAGTLAGKYLWDKTGERFEKGQLSRSLMGVLASAREKST